ncbi:MAG: HEPN domain-containing protein [Dehalococcoidia bacterium]
MRPEAQRWLKQGEADLEGVRVSLQGERYEWACFQAQQAAEKMLKALLYNNGLTSIMTHSLKELLAECVKLHQGLTSLEEEATFLDTFYLTTRYPNSLVGTLTPAEYYGRKDAEKCLSSAESILGAVKSIIGG